MHSDWLRDPQPGDPEFIGENLRQEDLIECLAQGRTGVQSLTQGMARSEDCKTATFDGQPVGMLGVVPGGFIWLLGTPAMVSGPASVRFIRECHKILPPILEKYPLIGNVSWVENTKHHRWLEYLGFTVDRQRPLKIGGLDHFYFWKESHV